MEAEYNQLIADIMNYEPQPEQKTDLKYCSLCDKNVSGKNLERHNNTKGHIKNKAIAEAHADNMNNLAVKDCTYCRASFGDWREHSETLEHKLNEAEAKLSALSAE